MFTYCSTSASVVEAVKVLSNADYVLIDCEGRNLGNASGALSLICIGTPHATEIFIFDALALPDASLQHLFDGVLCSPAVMKVTWDGRMDYSELYFTHGCAIEDVLDLQLVDILSRAKQGETQYNMRGRLTSRFFPPQEIQRLQVDGIHALSGMDRAMREHGVTGAPPKDDSVKQLHKDNLTDMWMHRPLSSDLLAYAAGDILRISALYDHFFGKGLFQTSLDELKKHSARYVAMHRKDGRKPDQADQFLRGPFLPPFVLDPLPDTMSGIQCTRCQRTMKESQFPAQLSSNWRGMTRSPICKVCTLITAREAYQVRMNIPRNGARN